MDKHPRLGSKYHSRFHGHTSDKLWEAKVRPVKVVARDNESPKVLGVDPVIMRSLNRAFLHGDHRYQATKVVVGKFLFNAWCPKNAFMDAESVSARKKICESGSLQFFHCPHLRHMAAGDCFDSRNEMFEIATEMVQTGAELVANLLRACLPCVGCNARILRYRNQTPRWAASVAERFPASV